MELPLKGNLEESVFLYPVRVYFSDTDAGGVVYHARYLDFAEHARSELLRTLGGSQGKMLHTEGSAFVIRTARADFLHPGRLDDLLTVETRVTRCSRVVIAFQQIVRRDDSVLCVLEIKAGFVSLTTGRPRPMPENWRRAIEPMVSLPV